MMKKIIKKEEKKQFIQNIKENGKVFLGKLCIFGDFSACMWNLTKKRIDVVPYFWDLNLFHELG